MLNHVLKNGGDLCMNSEDQSFYLLYQVPKDQRWILFENDNFLISSAMS